MSISIINKQGEETGRKAPLLPTIFQIEPNKHVIYLNVVHTQKKRRQGTAQTKERSDVVGSSKKLWRQKGTGRARVSDGKTNIQRGGGRAHGPRSKENCAFKLNKQVKNLALRSTLSLKAQQNQIGVVADFRLEKPSTKNYLLILDQLGLQNKKVLWVLPATDTNMILSAKNIRKSSVITVDQINTYQLLHSQQILFFETALPLIEQKYA